MPSLIIITTSHSALGTSSKLTGLWLEELTTPYYQFVDAGVSVTLASIQGGPIPVDPASQKVAGENTDSVERFFQDETAQRLVETSLAIAAVNISEYDAVFLPGGHGTMWDLPESDDLAQVIAQALAQNKVVAAVCHGPAGLVSARTSDGRPVVEGRRLSAFTNGEEEAVGLAQIVPFLLETRLRELGAEFCNAPDFQGYAIADGNLITGQNPASSTLVADKVLEAISASTSA